MHPKPDTQDPQDPLRERRTARCSLHWLEAWIERRRKAGDWQRVDEHSNLDLLADALSSPGQQEER